MTLLVPVLGLWAEKHIPSFLPRLVASCPRGHVLPFQVVRLPIRSRRFVLQVYVWRVGVPYFVLLQRP